jgi:thymidylate synthase (FAD)
VRIVKQSVTLLQCTPEPCKLIEAAGRTCYKSECKITPTSAAKFVKMLMKRRHYSVIEHAVATFRIVTDRAIAQEITRHRIASYSAESTRYVTYGDEGKGGPVTYILPSGMDSWHTAQWMGACTDAERSYLSMLDHGARPEQARSVLPLCVKSELVMTANFREWHHFLRLRCATTAHPEIQEVALMVAKELAVQCPEIFEEFTEVKSKTSNTGKDD